MAFPKSVPTSWVVRQLATAGTNSYDLRPFEFGIFDEDTHQALASGSVTSRNRRRVYLAAGSPHQKQFTQGSKQERIRNQLNQDVTLRSEPVSLRNVDLIRFQSPVKVEKPNVYYLGYNGIDSCKTLKFECGKTYMFNVHVKGRPVRNILGNDFNEIIQITTGCCDDCNTTCESGTNCSVYVDELVRNFNDPNRWTSRFFTAEKVISADCAPTLEQTEFIEYTLTVCDNGDELALSAVQNTVSMTDYTQVVVKERHAPYTTYQVIEKFEGQGQPSNFTQTSVVLQNCEVCPSGFSSVAGGYASIITVDNELYTAAAGATVIAKLSDLTGVTVTSASVVSTTANTTQYYAVSTTEMAATDGVVVDTLLGVVPARCTGPTTTTVWAEGETFYKVQRDICLTVKVDDCDTDFNGSDTGETLERLEAAYAAYPEVADGLALDDTSTDCLLRYTSVQFNNKYLLDGCDTYAVAEFDELPLFEGQRWTVCPCEGWTVNEDTGCPIPPADPSGCCQCGIKFTGRETTEVLDEFPGYDYFQYLEKEPVVLSVSLYTEENSLDICNSYSPTWFQSQRATFRQLRGDDVIKYMIKEQFYNKIPWLNQVDKENQLFHIREGIKKQVDEKAFYYAISLYHNVDVNGNNTAHNNNLRETVTLYINEADLALVDSLKAYFAESFPDAKLEGFA